MAARHDTTPFSKGEKNAGKSLPHEAMSAISSRMAQFAALQKKSHAAFFPAAARWQRRRA